MNRFFHELNPDVYKAVVLAWDDLIAQQRRLPADGQILADFDQKQLRQDFLTLTRTRESILYYSEPRVVLSDDPKATLTDLFGAYVERRFAHLPEYQEKVMCDRVEHVLHEAKVLDRYLKNDEVGDEVFHVRFPFVRRTEAFARPRQAIKALHLDETAPEALLFVLQGPQNRSPKHAAAFDQVRRDLDHEKIPHVLVEAEAAIRDFAAQSM